MIKTTILSATLMEVIVAKKVLKRAGINTVMNAYVLKFQKQLEVLLNVLINGSVTACVMIKTTILSATLMEVIVAKRMLKRAGINTVMNAYVLKFQKQLELLLNVLINGSVTAY